MKNIDWTKAWEEAQNRSRKNANMRCEALWNDYWDAVAGDYLRDSVADEWFYREIIEYLRMESLFKNGDTVLDVGCGPGTYSLPFAEDARAVCALDTSRSMLKALTQEAAKRGLSNILEINCGWDEYRPTIKFDLVFSSMSPAIHDLRTLLKMEECSSRGCCVVTYGEAFEYPVIKDLWGKLVGAYEPSNAYLYIYPYNILREMGRNPSIRMLDHEYGQRLPLDRVVEQYTTYFRIFTEVDDAKAQAIRDYFEARSDHGVYENTKKMRLAAIGWRAPGDR